MTKKPSNGRSKQTILVVDDEIGIRELLAEILHEEGYYVILAEDGETATKKITAQDPDLVLLDIWMPDIDGVTLLKEWHQAGLVKAPIVMMSGHATIETAVDAVRMGAVEVLEKPIATERLLKSIKKALERSGAPVFDPVLKQLNFGKTPAMQTLKEQLMLASSHSNPVVFEEATPDSGALFYARLLARTGKPWKVIGDTKDLELNPIDLLKQATGGILFVRGIHLLSIMRQRGLYLSMYNAPASNVRILCASGKPVSELCEDPDFDSSLAEILQQHVIQIPALNDYLDDLPEVSVMISKHLVSEKQVPARRLGSDAINMLRNNEWSGSFAALQAVIQNALFLSEGEEVDKDIVSQVLKQSDSGSLAGLDQNIYELPLRDAREQFEREYFRRLLRFANGNFMRAAQKAGLERTYLYRKLKQLNLEVAEDRGV